MQENEIDLKELFKIIWDSRKFIAIFTFLVTLISIIYVSLKNPTPIYQGSLLVEIGEIKAHDSIFRIDNPNNIKYILEAESKVEVTIPNRTNNLILLNVKDENIEKIEERINSIYEVLLKKQETKLKMYKEYIPTRKITSIVIDKKAINQPNKKLMVIMAFVIGFILSIFLVLFMSFLNSSKKEETDDTRKK